MSLIIFLRLGARKGYTMMRSVWVICFFVAIFTGTAHAQFTVGGVTGGAPTTDVNCFGDADGKILAYSQGWTAADCGIYTLVCNANQFTCPPANTLCTDGEFCGAGGPHVSITSPSSTETAALEAINTDPTITALNCSNASAGITYSCPVVALDAEGNTLTYSTDAQAITGWLSINPNTGILSGTPNVSGAVPEFTVTVTDGYAGSASATSNSFSVTNIPPAFANVTCPIATVGTSYVCATGASDSDGHSITYTKVTGPDWIEVASNGNLTADTVGASSSAVQIRANDGYDNTTSGDYTIVLNTAPTFSSISCSNGVVGTAYNCSISSNDAESDDLEFTLQNAPSWASLNEFGDVVGNTPVNGEYTGITIAVSDGYVTTTSEEFSITIDPNTAQKAADALSAAQGGTLTKAALDSILDDRGETSAVDLSDPASLAYVQNCIAAEASSLPEDIAACATGATASGVAKYALSSYQSTFTIDSELLADAGLEAADASLLADTGANSCFGTSCHAVMIAFLGSSGNTLTSETSASDIKTALNTAFEDHYASLANAVTPVTDSNAPQVNSCAVVTANAPSLCSHQPASHIYCTVHTSNFSINNPTYDTVSYNGSTSAIASTTYKDYVIKYKSRRSDRVLRTETRKLKIIVASGQTSSWQSMQNNSTCSNARSACQNAGGTVGTINDLASNNSLFASFDYVLASKDGSDYSFNKYYVCNNAIECHTLGGSNYNRRSCSGSSFANLKVLCNKPVCN